MSKIYVLGNPTLEEDALPVKLLPKLQSFFPDINFIHIDPTEELPQEEHLLLLDTIINTNEIKILKDIDKLHSPPSFSLHDFDLATNLKLLKKLGKLKEVTIIGLPPSINEHQALEELKHVIQTVSRKHE